MSVDQILAGSTFPKDDVDICMRQDLDLKRRDLVMELARAQARMETDDSRLGKPRSSDGIDRLEKEIEELEKEMAASTLTFHFQGVASAEYTMLQRTAGRPRKNVVTDDRVGYNIQAFFEKAIVRCCYKVTAPDGDEKKFTAEEWTEVFKRINDGQFDDLCECVEKVNRRKARNPLKARTSEEVSDSEPTQQPPTDSESQSSDGEAGSPEQAPE